MTLAAKLAFQFDKKVQIRGQDLYYQQAVKVIEASPTQFVVEVRGSRLYEVDLAYEEGALIIGCDCPYYADQGPCKHIWAAILEADRRGSLAEARNSKYLQLEDDLDDEEDFDGLDGSIGLINPMRPALPPPPPQPPLWQERLTSVQRMVEGARTTATAAPRDAEIFYVVGIGASKYSGAITLELKERTRKKNGDWSVLKSLSLSPSRVMAVQDALDSEVLTSMLGSQEYYGYSYRLTSAATGNRVLPAALAVRVIPKLAGAGRLWLDNNSRPDRPDPLVWDDGEAWKLWLDVRRDENDQWNIAGSLRRGSERMELTQITLVVQGGFVFTQERVARFDDAGQFPWLVELMKGKPIPFPNKDRDVVLAQLLDSPAVPSIDFDEELRYQELRETPKLALRISQKLEKYGTAHFEAHLLFDYGRGWMEDVPGKRGIWHAEERVYVVRDTAAENAARETLKELGLRPASDGRAPWRMTPKSMLRTVRELIQAGWHVEAEGKVFRSPGAMRVDVRSGIDWFELHGEVDYGESMADLPQLLAALRRGDGMVALGDGTFGILPEEWLARFAPLAGLGGKEDDHLRFRQNQAGLLDALLAAQPEVVFDAGFARVRERLQNFQGVKAMAQPEGFVGQLRHYQMEGMGWMEFLREFGFGGCLADDMGVGKTAQVLGTLELRRSQGFGPSLVVAPRSLMFNWREEAARFTPQLRVLEHLGLGRDAGSIGGHDLVLTTYGTLLRDAPQLSEVEFDYVILDEAQAIKNASTASAKAVRLLRGSHRLALSGTPIENHLGELWSLFEFLNPGMLGEAKVLKMAGGLANNPGVEARQLLAQALRPFILRRTKRQVASELPEKTEQTIFCELEGPQRKHYDELRQHYRQTLLNKVDKQGLGRSKMHVLEALLRLRQAACHPGLLDPKRIADPSAKLDVLLEQLSDLREEGHKALVFSQFTSLLAIVRDRLDARNVNYEYLDGATRDRQAHVERFQNDPACELFLISLKAGGLGLNLTAAEYVFLLDPWWNPAVEAQAVDRAHRIGQTKPVFAYRLIAKDTVEEKVLELQKTKRELADAILGEDNSLIRDLKREDLELLLS
jgi:superfamily II DNA or RNA helicase